ncbi:MAG: hypothetical protein ACXAB7_05060 [Candidatus Kariarchaeaceae archaeon]
MNDSVFRLNHKVMKSSNYIFFRFPSHYLFILGGLFPGMIAFLSINKLSMDETNPDQIYGSYLDQYITGTKIALIAISSFYITYRWSLMKKDGNYGFWMTQGVSRVPFFTYTISLLVIEYSLGMLLSLLILTYTFGLVVELSKFITIMLLLFASTVLLIGFAVFLGEIINNPELASLVYIITHGINYFLNNDDSSFWHSAFKNELHYHNNDILIPFFTSLFLGILLLSISLGLHLKDDIEL